MASRKVLKVTPVLVTINIFVILIIIGFYSFRLIKYYRLENGPKDNDEVVLVDTIIKRQSVIDLTKGLVLDEEDNTYRYKGEVNDNYVLYSGILFRIISIDANKNIKMISDNNLTLMYSGLEKGYQKSFVNKWLNKTDSSNSGIFESVLYEKDKYLNNTEICFDVIDDLNNITCSEKNSDNKNALLSLYDYKEAGGVESYLNNGETFYLGTVDSNNSNYYINEKGNVGLNNISTKVLGVRSVITIKADTLQLSGNGKKSSPYIIEKHDISTLNKTYVGDIVNFSGTNYKVIEINDEKVKIAAMEVIKNNDTNLEMPFNASSSAYSSVSKVGKYLNNDFYNTLENKDKIITSNWYIGTITLDDLDYADVFVKKISANIGMLTLGDFYVHDLHNIFTLSRGIESSSIINVINSNGYIYGDFVTNNYNVRPAFYLDGNIEIKSGIGTVDGPYELVM